MLVVNHQDFLNALKRACKVIPKHATTPAFHNVNITVTNDSMIIAGTNLNEWIVEILPVQSEDADVSVCIPAHLLQRVLTAQPRTKHEITLEASTEHFIIGTTKIDAGCPLADFPSIPSLPDQAHAVIDLPEDFPAHARFVRAAVDQTTTRYALRGMLFDFVNGNLVGSDGKRLHCAHVWEPSKVGKFIIPPEVFDLGIPSQLIIPSPNKEGTTEQVFFTNPTGYVVIKTIEGQFPDYQKVLRSTHRVVVHVDRQELMSAIEQALPVVEGATSPACQLHLNEAFEIQAKNTMSGMAFIIEVPATIEGPEITLILNPHYFLILLRTMLANDVTLAFNEPKDSVYIHSDLGQHWALLMPLDLESVTPTAETEKEQK